MARVVFTASADADSAFVLDDLNAKAGKLTVVKYRSLFKTLYEVLAAFPDSGAPRPRLGSEIRIGIVSPYIVIYRHTEADNLVTVLRIVHGSRKITAELLGGASRSKPTPASRDGPSVAEDHNGRR
jgi:toxin ParE1/3/4